ncbi:hypothetical protein UlMin_034495 [Ulmus minor]
MADDKGKEEVEKKDTVTAPAVAKKKRKGIISRIWNGIFRLHGDDFEKRLQHISKEEAAILTRMKRRSLSWSQTSRQLVAFSLIFEVFAIGYGIITTRTTELDWKSRALRLLPIFLLPALSSFIYWAYRSFTRMCDRKDLKTLDRLRAERQAKIDELKEKTNYYTTQQLIQRYDTDPAAKAAAATVLASKLGADSGLKLFMEDETKAQVPTAKSNDVELVQSGGLRNRKQAQHNSSSSAGNSPLHHSDEGTPHSIGSDGPYTTQNDQLVVNHHFPQGPSPNDGGWIARIAALLVGEDPTQSYALICGNCHMHNGLARKEDFPYITYYCPHCHALNKSLQSEEQRVSGSSTPNSSSINAMTSGDAMNSLTGSVSKAVILSNSSMTAVPETEEVTNVAATDVPS